MSIPDATILVTLPLVREVDTGWTIFCTRRPVVPQAT